MITAACRVLPRVLETQFVLSPLLPPMPHRWLDVGLSLDERRYSDLSWGLFGAASKQVPFARAGYRQFVTDDAPPLPDKPDDKQVAGNMEVFDKTKSVHSRQWLDSFMVCRLCEELCHNQNNYSHCCHDILMTVTGEPYDIALANRKKVEAVPRTRKSKFKHVYYVSATNRWRVFITVGGQRLYFGLHEHEEQAGEAVDNFLYYAWQEHLIHAPAHFNFPLIYSRQVDVPAPFPFTEKMLPRLRQILNSDETRLRRGAVEAL